MANLQEKLASSLQVLKEYQDRNGVEIIQGMNALGKTHTQRLINNGYLEQIVRGWYVPTFPGSNGDSSIWYAYFWKFVTAYCNARFKDDWCLTPDESLAIHSGNYLVPAQLVIRTSKGSNNILSLKHNTSILDISVPIAKNCKLEPIYGLRIYSLAEAIVFASPSMYQTESINVRTCLASVNSASDILKAVLEDGNSVRAGRIAGAMQNIGREDVATEIIKVMTRLGYDIRVTDPFNEKITVPINESPYSTRIRLAWQQMRKQIIDACLIPTSQSHFDINYILSQMDAQYIHDAYHSLSIEGYRVTEGLIERVRSGNWNPQDNQIDADQKNALAARGYYQAFQSVRSSIKEILEGKSAGEVISKDYDTWHFELFEPCVQAGIISASDLLGYRTHQVYIRESKHTPLNPNAVRPAMNTLCNLLKEETIGFIQSVLGHFFFVYIHPYMDGNGRTARFVMNAMLTTSGLPWTIIPTEKRDEYMQALEVASVEGNILPFAKLIQMIINSLE